MMPTLVVLQVALACAIACNALFMLQQKLRPILGSDGVGQPDRLIVAWQIAARGEPWAIVRLREAETALRAIPGVNSVGVAGSLPMVINARMNADAIADASGVKANAGMYIGDHLVKTLGLKLVAGRDFSTDEDATVREDIGMSGSGPVIITRALAAKLFPGGQPLGKTIRLSARSDAPQRTVIGVVAHLMRNDFDPGNRRALDYTMLLPGIPGKWPFPSIGVRINATASAQQVRKQVKSAIEHTLGPRMVQGIDPIYDDYGDLRAKALAGFRAAVWLLSGVTVIVLIVTLAGIMGMTSYWVQQRTRQIGIRRALGARRRDILRYLQLENFIVVGSGVALGVLMAYVVNLWLMRHYELMRLPWAYLPVGAILLLMLGQAAVLGPALRAAAVPPVVATRSV